ncbi:phospholipase A2 [Gandjariella thermophila]|uniref:Phospholipase n=1 Tax=Gandjariella thermophila TaxID=1931992 RepID=A0A4D4JEE7_9PSEU|nr:phospholipase A2 [Gandjariella thermophila]GDY32223.1 phospholipase [Gandjariella thermophila]
MSAGADTRVEAVAPGSWPGLAALCRLPKHFRVLVIALIVFVCGVLVSRPVPPAAAQPTSGEPAQAAHAVDDLVQPSATRDARPDIPADFTATTGAPAPVTVRTPDGLLRTVNPAGGCSAPWGEDNTPWDFGIACKAHDLGYDLLRYEERKGQPLGQDTRRALDARLARDMHAQCEANPRGSARECHVVADVYAAGAEFNSWRQRWGPPNLEPVWAWVVGFAAVAALLLARLPGGRPSRRSAPGLAGTENAERAPPKRVRRRAARAAPVAVRPDRYLTFLRLVGLALPVLGESLSTVAHWAGVDTARLAWLTWVLQAVPVFFFAGGQANLAGWRAVRERAGGFGRYLAGRTSWLLRPVLAFVLAWLVVPLPLEVLGVPRERLEEIGRLIAHPLWSLGVYLVVVAATPVMAWLHRHARLATPAVLAVAVPALDVLRTLPGWGLLGAVNVVVLALLLQQCGFLYADGVLQRLPGPVLGGAAALGALGLAWLIIVAGYSATMMAGRGGNPPTICLLALAVSQIGLAVLLRDRAAGWLDRHGPWHAVSFIRSAPMTLYLGYLAGLLVGTGVVGALSARVGLGRALAWLGQPRWLVALVLLLVPLLAAFLRFERPRRFTWPAPVESYRGRLAATLGVLYGALGVLGFVVTGFAGVPGEGWLLVLPVDPLQNLVHLLLGWYLVHTARVGTSGNRLPWLLTALACLPALLAPGFSTAGVLLHGATITVAALAAAARPRTLRVAH